MYPRRPLLPAVSTFALASLIAGLPLSGSASDGLFVQAGAGYGEVTFEPHYRFVDGSPSRAFRDQKQDGVKSLGVGYQKQLNDRISVGVSAEYIRQDVEWTLYLPSEPASFSYEIPNTVGLMLTPAWHPTEDWRLFAELGAISGQLKERKYSSVTSHYDADEWVGGVLVGVGVGYRFHDHLELTLGYRELRYGDLNYRSYLPNGTHRAHVEDSPTGKYTSIGLRYRF